LLVFAELISSTLKMEAICSSETSVETQRTTRHNIPEYDTLTHYIALTPARAERVGLVVKLKNFIREVLDSILGTSPAILIGFYGCFLHPL
jgi:hypothetical protein